MHLDLAPTRAIAIAALVSEPVRFDSVRSGTAGTLWSRSSAKAHTDAVSFRIFG